MNLNGNSLTGTAVIVYEADTHKVLATKASINQAARYVGKDSRTLGTYLYSRRVFESPLLKKRVYIKEKL